uniref:Uncharacterized protein n=1 Tax=Cacopsylla melanoneura TaxID=428564 RepID=A0A8D9ACK1_9HEMI
MLVSKNSKNKDRKRYRKRTIIYYVTIDGSLKKMKLKCMRHLFHLNNLYVHMYSRLRISCKYDKVIGTTPKTVLIRVYIIFLSSVNFERGINECKLFKLQICR